MSQGLVAPPGQFCASLVPASFLTSVARLWRRRIQRIIRVHAGANVTLELSGRTDGTGPLFFLRLCRPGQAATDLDAELHLLRKVPSRVEATVATPLSGRGGRARFRLPWEGSLRHAVLFTEAHGRSMQHNVSDLKLYGRGLAVLHHALAASGVTSTRSVEPAATCCEAALWLRRAGPETANVADTVDTAAAQLVRALSDNRPLRGVVHGDSCLLNARLDNEERVTFFDFEDCGCGPLALDLASMDVWLRGQPDGPTLWSALLAGYEGVRPLTLGERRALPALVLLATVRITGSLAQHYAMSDELWRIQHDRLRQALVHCSARRSD